MSVELEQGIGRRRIMLATRFYDEVLLPTMANGDKINMLKIFDMMNSFREENQGTGSDFDLDHVWGAALKRFDYVKDLNSQIPSIMPAYSHLAEPAWKLLTDIQLSQD